MPLTAAGKETGSARGNKPSLVQHNQIRNKSSVKPGKDRERQQNSNTSSPPRLPFSQAWLYYLRSALPSPQLLQKSFSWCQQEYPPKPKNNTSLRVGAPWWDQALLCPFCISPFPVHPRGWTHAQLPFGPCLWLASGHKPAFLFIFTKIHGCLSTQLASAVTIRGHTVAIIYEVSFQFVFWGSSFCYFRNGKYPYFCCGMADREIRSVTSWFLYIISTCQNMQIGAFSLGKKWSVYRWTWKCLPKCTQVIQNVFSVSVQVLPFHFYSVYNWLPGVLFVHSLLLILVFKLF